MRGSSRLVSRKWPKWLTANCSSKPSFVLVSGHAITPVGWKGKTLHGSPDFQRGGTGLCERARCSVTLSRAAYKACKSRTCVVTENVEGLPGLPCLLAELSDRVQVGEIQVHGLDLRARKLFPAASIERLTVSTASKAIRVLAWKRHTLPTACCLALQEARRN